MNFVLSWFKIEFSLTTKDMKDYTKDTNEYRKLRIYELHRLTNYFKKLKNNAFIEKIINLFT